MKPEPLNPWLDSTLRKANRLFEDSDRRSRAARQFVVLLGRVHRLASVSAIRCGTPKLERFQEDESSPSLMVEWFDQASGWHLYFCVRRGPQVKPFVQLNFGGTKTYTKDEPTDADITQALHDYFESWKHEGDPRL